MVNTRLMTKQDLPRFVALWNQGYKTLTSSQFKMTLQKAYSGFNKKMFIYYGIYVDNHLQGFALLKDESKILWLKHLLIEKRYRNKKMGSLLLKKIENISKKNNKPIRVEVLKNNPQALKFFLKKQYKLVRYDLSENQYVLEKTNP